MNQSEPTTGEIVRALRYCTDENSICGTACPAYLSEAGCRTTVMKNAIDRLESQERDIETLRAFHERYAEQTSKKYVNDICALTARAEQAERERDAAIKDITRLCTRCKHWTCPNDDEPCLSCLNAESGNPNWTWRGLPQEGEKE